MENTPKIFKRNRIICQKHLVLSPQSPKDIKLSLCGRTFDRNQKTADPNSSFQLGSNKTNNHITLDATVPLKALRNKSDNV
jgi:hypothetical protein